MFIVLHTGTIKSCVLIENILATFEMESILYELRHHCIGLNCGIWDYSASIISLFGIHFAIVFDQLGNFEN
jgi:malate synthase